MALSTSRPRPVDVKFRGGVDALAVPAVFAREPGVCRPIAPFAPARSAALILPTDPSAFRT
jgi:hypothetical protein